MANRDTEAERRSEAGGGRMMSLLGGGLALAWGLRRRGLPGLLVGTAGGLLLRRSIADRAAEKGVSVSVGISIDRSPQDLYRFWHGFTRLPEFMEHLEEVTPRAPNLTHWVARVPGGAAVEWDSEVVDDVPDERIAWRTVPGSELMNEGEVSFVSASGLQGQGTQVRLDMRFYPPGGLLGDGAGRLLRGTTETAIRQDLRRFKQIMESEKAAPGSETIQ